MLGHGQFFLSTAILETISKSDEGLSISKISDRLVGLGYSNKEKVLEEIRLLEAAGLIVKHKDTDKLNEITTQLRGAKKAADSAKIADLEKRKKELLKAAPLKLTDFGKDLSFFDQSIDECYIERKKLPAFAPRGATLADKRTRFLMKTLVDVDLIKVIVAFYYYLVLKHGPNGKAFSVLDRYLVNRLIGHLTQRVNRRTTLEAREEKFQESVKNMQEEPNLVQVASFLKKHHDPKIAARASEVFENYQQTRLYPNHKESNMLSSLLSDCFDGLNTLRKAIPDSAFVKALDELVNPLKQMRGMQEYPWKRGVDLPGQPELPLAGVSEFLLYAKVRKRMEELAQPIKVHSSS